MFQEKVPPRGEHNFFSCPPPPPLTTWWPLQACNSEAQCTFYILTDAPPRRMSNECCVQRTLPFGP